MAFSPENRHNNPLVDGKNTVERQLELRFQKAREDEASAWGRVFAHIRKLTVSDWVKLVGAGFLIGAAWYFKGYNKFGELLEDGGKGLVRQAWKRIRPK